jgi:polyisoprenoid-binding protein YceI
MTSIKVKDLQGETAGKLEGHLKSDDFFSAATFPTATLIILEAKDKGKGNYEIKANLTIKGITQPVTFPAAVTQDGSRFKATAQISIDRSLYEVKYGSGKFCDNLGDKTIYDNFDLTVALETE